MPVKTVLGERKVSLLERCPHMHCNAHFYIIIIIAFNFITAVLVMESITIIIMQWYAAAL